MKITCDICGAAFEDSLLQILERGGEILYACPECFVENQGQPPEEQA